MPNTRTLSPSLSQALAQRLAGFRAGLLAAWRALRSTNT